MIRKLHKVGLIELVAGGPKQIDIPAHLGTITGIYFMPKSSSGVLVDGKTVASIASISLTVNPKNGTAFELIKPTSPEKLKRRELYFGSIFGVENAESILTFDPSAALFGSEATRSFMNLGGEDVNKFTVEVTSNAVLDGVAGVEVWIEYDPVKFNLGPHVRLSRSTQKIPATGGDIEIVHLPKNSDNSFQYQKIDIGIPANMTIDKVSVVVDNGTTELRELPVTLINRMLVEAGRTPQAGVVTLDFSKESFATYFLPGKMTDFKVIPHFVPGVGAAEAQIDIDIELLYNK